MIIKLRIGHIRITFTIARIIDVLGVNSKLPDGNHILMWDFDNTKFKAVLQSLLDVRGIFRLPEIHILETSKPDNYIAYCFKRCTFRQAIKIIGSTDGVDLNFYKWGIFRKRWTLRIGAKAGVIPHAVATLEGISSVDVDIKELKSWVTYETLDMHHKQRIYKFGERYYAKN
jgi:hypothetical protein